MVCSSATWRIKKLNARFELTSFETNQGAQIYRIPLNGFPDFWVYAYLVLVEDYLVLIDTGTNFHTSNTDLEKGFGEVSVMNGRDITFADLTHIFISHGHIDHIAGLSFVAPKTKALIAVHELDYRILANYQERKVVVSKRMREFLLESGVTKERVESIMEMYMSTKALFDSSRVDITYEDEGMQIGPFSFLNVPGHSSGAVAIRLHDVVFTGDHVLSAITPHMAPERLTLGTGLSHYLESLAKIKEWAGDVRLALGGHEDPITNLKGRVGEIAEEHKNRLGQVIGILEEPRTVSEVSRELFGEVYSYNVLLALEETGAHIEYLYKLGFIGIENLEEVEVESEVVPIRYRSLRSAVDLEKVFPTV
jgi:glyoxylase-like metal-dependent hydrolase (beta-lactamase superfamily II)